MPHALTNSTGKGCLLAKAGTVHDQTSSFTSSPLRSNETEFMQFTVNVPKGTTPGSYTLFALVNSTTSNAQGTLVMTVQSQASLPLGGAQIPVSLILILLPGFVTVLIILWLNGALNSSWQTGLVAVLFSVFFGVVEWMYFFQGRPSFHGISASIIFNLDPSILPRSYFESVGIWSIIIGFGVGVLVLVLNYVPNWISEFLKGPSESKDPTWETMLRKSLKEAIVLRGPAWYPQVRVTLSSSPAEDGRAAKPQAPAVAKKNVGTTKVISTDKTVKDKNILIGLLQSFDAVNPNDIGIAPQYSITLDKEGWESYAEKYHASKGMTSKGLETFLRNLNENRFPKGIEQRVSWVLKKRGKREILKDQSDNVVNNNIIAREWIKGSTIQTLEIFDPMPQYVFKLAP